MSELKVYTFAPAWGLPTSGPFALKLLAWLNFNGIAYDQKIENRSGKGPKGKSPWIELGGKLIGDSDLIIDTLARHHGLGPQNVIDTPEAAAAWALKTAFEEHFHQVLEWELFVHPEGLGFMRGMVRESVPPVISALVLRNLARHFRRQLAARGIGRHAPAEIEAQGRRDIEMLARWLEGRAFICGEAPGLADMAVFGQVAPLASWPMDTPVAGAVKETPTVMAWVDRMKEACL